MTTADGACSGAHRPEDKQMLSTLKDPIRQPYPLPASWRTGRGPARAHRIDAPLGIRHHTKSYHLMLLPVVAFLCVFSLYPLLGSVLAFKSYQASKGIWGSPWAGMENFAVVFSSPHFYRILRNTVVISLMKICLNLLVPLVFALMLNEVRLSWFRRGVQTITYLPYFLSWVILAGVFKDILSSAGLINKVLGQLFGTQPFMFFASVPAFPFIVVLTDSWKDFGFNAILYLAALSSIDIGLYEAAKIDGASRWQQLLNVTVPGLTATIVLLAALSLQNVLNAGFEQILNLYNPLVYQSGDILDTYVYRMGLIDSQFEVATAIGLLKSAVGFCFIYAANALAGRYANYRIF
jgi:putative aldouronate transport system permease protein